MTDTQQPSRLEQTVGSPVPPLKEPMPSVNPQYKRETFYDWNKQHPDKPYTLNSLR
jgi:hypothetical protein